MRFFTFLAEDIRELLAELGFRGFQAVRGWKSRGVDLSPLLVPAMKKNPGSPVVCRIPQDHGIDDVLDRKLIELARPAVEKGQRVEERLAIHNTDRAVGGMLSNYIVSRKGAGGLRRIRFTSS